MDDKRYIEFVVDSPFNRGHFIPVDRLGAFITANKDRVMYHSLYAFDHSIALYHQKHGTLKGFEGTQYPFRTIIDIDSDKGELGKAAAVAIEIYQYMTDYFEIENHNIRIWFSGSKGFHIEMPNVFGFEPSSTLFGTVKATYKVMFEKWLEYVDLAPTMWSGLIRTPWSYHSKSGLYKCPLSFNQLTNIANAPDQAMSLIKKIASKENYLSQSGVLTEMTDENDNQLNEFKVEKEQIKNYQQQNDLDNPNTKVTCMQKLAMRGPIQGQRHQDVLRLASSWRRQGIIHSLARPMLFEWLDLDDNESNSEWVRILDNVYKQGYSYGCKDKVMASLCDSKCIFFKHKDYVMEVNNASSLQMNYQTYMENVMTNGIDIPKLFGFTNTSYKVVPGEVAIFTGETGAGKTALVCDLIRRAQRKTLYGNFEMHEMLLYRRIMQAEHSLTKHEFHEAIEDGIDFSEDVKWLDILSQQIDIKTLEKKITEDLYDLVVIDTSDGIRDDSTHSEYTKLGNVMNTMRTLAQENNMIVLIIHHLKKRDNIEKLITLDDLSGNRANVTKMDHVFAIEAQTGANRTLRSLKTRDGQPLNLDFKFDYLRMRYNSNNTQNYYARDRQSGGLTGGSSGAS